MHDEGMEETLVMSLLSETLHDLNLTISGLGQRYHVVIAPEVVRR